MSNIIITNDGTMHIVSGVQDMLALIEEHLGTDSKVWIEEWTRDQQKALANAQRTVKEYQEEHDILYYQRMVLADIYEDAEEVVRILNETDRMTKKEKSDACNAAQRIWNRLHQDL